VKDTVLHRVAAKSTGMLAAHQRGSARQTGRVVGIQVVKMERKVIRRLPDARQRQRTRRYFS